MLPCKRRNYDESSTHPKTAKQYLVRCPGCGKERLDWFVKKPFILLRIRCKNCEKKFEKYSGVEPNNLYFY
jgi:transcription elongation factor Elf1